MERMATGHQFDLPYMVEQWDDSDSHVEELIALTGDYRVARAAYEEAVKRRPGRIVTLRQKTDFWRTAAENKRGLHKNPLEETMTRIALAMLLSCFAISGAVADPTCHDKATDTKLSGAALNSFMTKCAKEATV